MSTPICGCVDLIERNEKTEGTKNKLTTYIINEVNCFCWDLNNKKSNIRGNGNNNDDDDKDSNDNDSNNKSSSNNNSYESNNKW